MCATCGQVVDFKLFEKGRALQPNTLWVVEEIPGLVEGADQTATLARGYWPSCAPTSVSFQTGAFGRPN